MTLLKIRIESDTAEEIGSIVEDLRQEYGITSVPGLPHIEDGEGKKYVQHLEVEIKTQPRISADTVR
jgi:hypothetical protein